MPEACLSKIWYSKINSLYLYYPLISLAMNDKITLDRIKLMHPFQFNDLPHFQKTMSKSVMQLKQFLVVGKVALKNTTYSLL
jgi:hypothetical protein